MLIESRYQLKNNPTVLSKDYHDFVMYCYRGATHEKKIEAILGTDLSIYYFNQLLEDKYPICANKTNYK